MAEAGGDITRLLDAWREGDREAAGAVVSELHAEIRRLAQLMMARERAGHTLQPTALISELYLRLMNGATPSFNDRGHFLAVATQHLRCILVDHARRKSAKRRAGIKVPVEEILDRAAGAGARQDDEVLLVDGALGALARDHERAARVMEMRYFAGLEVDEVAAALGVSLPTVKRDSAFARAWIGKYVRAQAGSAEENDS